MAVGEAKRGTMPGLIILNIVMFLVIIAGLAYIGLSRPTMDERATQEAREATHFTQEPIIAPSMKPDPSTSNNILLNNPINTSGTVSAGPAQDNVSEHNTGDTIE
ncbi:hypothetical protein KF913_08270 [Candidatus Obscuribacterales bacterium]|nr:hypothetical protein [Candidatus Obscuribacterales bacterium]